MVWVSSVMLCWCCWLLVWLFGVIRFGGCICGGSIVGFGCVWLLGGRILGGRCCSCCCSGRLGILGRCCRVLCLFLGFGGVCGLCIGGGVLGGIC